MPTLAVNGCPGGPHYKRHTPTREATRDICGAAPAAGTPLVLLHGAGGNLMHWPSELRRLPGSAVVALDLPGHGHSEGAAQPPDGDVPQDIGTYAQVVARFAGVLSLPRFVLAGHSMGGGVALELAFQHPEMLAGLILVATGARLPVVPELLSAIQDDYESAVGLMAGWSQGARSDPNMMRIYLKRLRESDPQVLYGDYAACNAWDRTADLGRITVPTLIVCGDADRMTPLQYSLDLQQRIKTAQLVIVPGAGHMVMLEQPAFVAREVQQFLTRLAALEASPPTTALPHALRAPGD
jgi:pimeloyl-ACP methyl ester carboxylesterase